VTPDSLPEPIAVASLVANLLNGLGVPYVIGGSFASSVHGEPRSTNDVDMVADLRLDGADAFGGERLSRRMSVEFASGADSIALFVDTAENTILRKLEWYRRGREAPSGSGGTSPASSTLSLLGSIMRICASGRHYLAWRTC
jgi:hypothetical protein